MTECMVPAFTTFDFIMFDTTVHVDVWCGSLLGFDVDPYSCSWVEQSLCEDNEMCLFQYPTEMLSQLRFRHL